jgi:hypothetical protein
VASDQQNARKPIQKYSLASLHGDYGAIGYYGANLALADEQFDGNGNLSGTALLNKPGTSGSRDLVTLPFTGTYTVNDDGTGVLYLTVTTPTGGTATATEDFLITEAEVIRGIPVATKMADAQREQNIILGNGVFGTHVYTRRPNRRADTEEDSH